MPNRRQFFKTVAGATAGMYVAGRGFTASALTPRRAGVRDGDPAVQAPPARRQVMIGGRRVRVIDVHCHWDMPIPASVVKGTAFEERVKGPGIEDRVAIMDKMG